MNWQQFLENKGEDDFFVARKKGANKIANEAKAKGGASQLTAWHFAAKSKPYEEAIQAIKDDKPKSFYISQCRSLVNKLKFPMDQQSFQEVMGRLEVWGEIVAKLFS